MRRYRMPVRLNSPSVKPIVRQEVLCPVVQSLLHLLRCDRVLQRASPMRGGAKLKRPIADGLEVVDEPRLAVRRPIADIEATLVPSVAPGPP